MRPAAELDRGSGVDDAHSFAVLLAGHRDRARGARLRRRHDLGDQMVVIANERVDPRDDIALLRRPERAAWRAEVEAHAVDADPRAGLDDIVAEHVLQRALPEVRARVLAPDLLAPERIDRGVHDVTRDDRSATHDSAMRDRSAEPLSVEHG